MEPVVHFTSVGKRYIDGKENEIVAMIRSVRWRHIEQTGIYLPFHLEHLIRVAIESNPLLQDTREYCSSGRLAPNDFIGLRSRFVRTDIECYFIGDGSVLTPVAEVFSAAS
jgi:hypothetical protein